MPPNSRTTNTSQSSVYPSAQALLSHADIALYRAKSEGRGTYRFFTDEMDTEVREEFLLSAELRQAIASHQLYLVYQPQVEIYTGRITGVEALVRCIQREVSSRPLCLFPLPRRAV